MDELISSLEVKGVLRHPNIKEAFLRVDRKDFVPPDLSAFAYEDHPLEIGWGQTISQPYTVAFMLDLLEAQAGNCVWDVGYGSGWTTALLAHIVGDQGRILAVERVPELCRFGEANVKKYPELTSRVSFFCGDATKLELPSRPDRILVGAAAERFVPESWKKELNINGRIVIPIRNSIWLFIKKSEGQFQEHEYPGFVFVPLISEK